MGGQRHGPVALPPGSTRYPLYRRLGGPQGRSGRVRKISPPSPPGFDPRTIQLVAIRYTDWAIPAETCRNFFCVYKIFSRFMCICKLLILGHFCFTENVHVTYDHDYTLQPIKGDGVLYMVIHNTTSTLEPKMVHIHLTNLFNGDSLLGECPHNAGNCYIKGWKAISNIHSFSDPSSVWSLSKLQPAGSYYNHQHRNTVLHITATEGHLHTTTWLNMQVLGLKSSVKRGHLCSDMTLGNTQYALRCAAI